MILRFMVSWNFQEEVVGNSPEKETTAQPRQQLSHNSHNHTLS
jgi:hypothetical protein